MRMVLPNNAFFAWVAEELEEYGKVRFRVKGVSMQPMLRDGVDEVLLEKCPAESLRKGDIVLFRYHGGYVLHRIFRIREGVFYMKGDNTYGTVENCRGDEVLGKVTGICRQKKEGSRFSEQKPYSFKWNVISSWWRFRCLVYRYASALWRRLR